MGLLDMAGERIGQLAVIERDTKMKGDAWWVVKCDYGTIKSIRGGDLRSGRVKACGCLKTTHGMTGSNEYTIWNIMRQRCRDETVKDWPRYGGRGVVVCAGWQKFENFFADMGKRPSKKHSVDRIDNDGNYSCGHCAECLENEWPANCRWITMAEQHRNTRRNKFITFNRETLCVSDWAKRKGMSSALLRWRLESGWGIEKALTEPVHSRAHP